MIADLIPLQNAHATALVGGKAANLARLIRLGYAVPPGFVIPDTFYQAHLDRCGIRTAAADLMRDLHTLSSAELAMPIEKIRHAIMQTPLDAALRAALVHCHNTACWYHKTLAVRSSGQGEDAAAHSFAGQLDTFLGLRTLATVEEAIRHTWASLWSSRVLLYQHHHRVRIEHIGVIVQEQVAARFSGVLFTRTPAGHSEQSMNEVMLCEYCPGLGDTLVGGGISPGQIWFDRRDGRLLKHDRSSEIAADVDILQHAACLQQLAELSLKIEQAFLHPQDIEWSIDHDGKLFFLQARPITTKTLSLEASAKQVVVWTNANIAENFPAPVTPFLYSIVGKGYTAYFRNLGLGFGISRRRIAAMHDALEHVVGVHGGRLYYNLSNIHALLYLAPGGKWLTRFFNGFTGAEQFPTPKLAALPGILELLWITLKTSWQYLFVEQRVAKFENNVDAYCRVTDTAHLASKSLIELRTDLQGFLDIRLRRWNGAALADTAAMVCYGLLQRKLKQVTGDPHNHQHNDLLKGLADLASLAPVTQLWELSRHIRNVPETCRLFVEQPPEIIWQTLQTSAYAEMRARLLDYLENWGFRNSGELMLVTPSPQEQPLPTLALLKVYIALDGQSPIERLQTQAQDRAAMTQQLLAHSWLSQCLLRATQASIRLRERARFRQARLYVRLRHVVLAIGDRLKHSGQLAHQDDIFFLTCDEIDELLAGHALFPYDLKGRVSERQASYKLLEKTNPTDSFVLAQGSYLPFTEAAAAPQPLSELESVGMRGMAACGGCITARAKVLGNADEGHLLQQGDILVTRQTDPGWASAFFLVGGLVVERGGMLSHGAIIAREYGIPAVVGVANATQKISNGSLVKVDGNHGCVDIL